MNYEVVVAYGRLDIHDDPVWLRSQVGNSPTIMKPGNNTRGPSTCAGIVCGQAVTGHRRRRVGNHAVGREGEDVTEPA